MHGQQNVKICTPYVFYRAFPPESVGAVVLAADKYGRTPIIRIDWDGEPSGYAENPDN